MKAWELGAETRKASRKLLDTGGEGMAKIGIPNWKSLAEQNRLGIASGEIDGRGYFDLTGFDDPPWHVVIPCVWQGVVIDLCAFRSRSPQRWGLRTGHGQMLGHDAIERALHGIGWGDLDAETLIVAATPLEWLRGGAQGVCVVDGFRPDTAAELRTVKRIEVPTPDLANSLRRRLAVPPHMPEIRIRGEHGAARNTA